LRLAGNSPDGRLVEIVEVPEHPFFLAVQFHPELKSRPERPHPLFSRFVRAAKARQQRPHGDETASALPRGMGAA
jgi:CTP synthase